MNTIRQILVPIDFLPHSAEAIRRALDLAHKYDADVTLLHVYEPAAYPMSPGDVVYDRDRLESASARVRARLEAVRRELDPTGRRRVSIRVLQGTPARAIIDAATEACADLIVMGTHGRTGVDRLMSGSITEDVLRRAPCPVLAINPLTPPHPAIHAFYTTPLIDTAIPIARLTTPARAVHPRRASRAGTSPDSAPALGATVRSVQAPTPRAAQPKPAPSIGGFLSLFGAPALGIARALTKPWR